LVWQIILTEVFSTLARLECLAGCRDKATRRYHHTSLVRRIAEEEIHPALRDSHQLIWKEWLKGTLEQQHADLLLYLCQPSIQKTEFIARLRKKPAFVDWAPDSADEIERARFQSNLSILRDLFANQIDVVDNPAHANPLEMAVVEEALRMLAEGYARSDFALSNLAGRLHISSRHLGRLFQRQTGQSFRKYLRDVRMRRAAHLFVTDEQSDVKTVVSAVGYSSRSHFDEDFRERFGCTPSQFRRQNAKPIDLAPMNVKQLT
jgi:AraC-like DNA-binding protein